MMQGLGGRIYSVLCAILALACLWFGVDEWLRWRGIALSAIIFLEVVAMFFAWTAVSVFRRTRERFWLAGISGSALVLYAISVILLGWEDVGGAAGAIPLALSTGLVGGLGLFIGLDGMERGKAA